MIQKEHLRKTQVKVGEVWEDVVISQLEKGDIFRMFEPDGAIVAGPDGKIEFIAKGPAYIEVETEENEIQPDDEHDSR